MQLVVPQVRSVVLRVEARFVVPQVQPVELRVEARSVVLQFVLRFVAPQVHSVAQSCFPYFRT